MHTKAWKIKGGRKRGEMEPHFWMIPSKGGVTLWDPMLILWECATCSPQIPGCTRGALLFFWSSVISSWCIISSSHMFLSLWFVIIHPLSQKIILGLLIIKCQVCKHGSSGQRSTGEWCVKCLSRFPQKNEGKSLLCSVFSSFPPLFITSHLIMMSRVTFTSLFIKPAQSININTLKDWLDCRKNWKEDWMKMRWCDDGVWWLTPPVFVFRWDDHRRMITWGENEMFIVFGLISLKILITPGGDCFLGGMEYEWEWVDQHTSGHHQSVMTHDCQTWGPSFQLSVDHKDADEGLKCSLLKT